jgi:hypothetical protein
MLQKHVPTLLCLLLSTSPAWAQPHRAAVTAAGGTAPARPGTPPPPAEPLLRPLAVGFSAEVRLRDAVQTRLLLSGRYRIAAAPQIPADRRGLFLGGRLLSLAAQDGFVACRVRFVLVGQPGLATLLVDTAAAEVPIGPDRQTAEWQCLGELAEQMAQRVMKTAR